MDSERMDLPLTPDRRAFVERRARQLGFASGVDFVLSLIDAQADLDLEDEGLDDFLEASLQSGQPVRADADYWERLRTRLRDRIEQRRAG